MQRLSEDKANLQIENHKQHYEIVDLKDEIADLEERNQELKTLLEGAENRSHEFEN